MYIILIFIVVGLIIANAHIATQYKITKWYLSIFDHIFISAVTAIASSMIGIFFVIAVIEFGWTGDGEYDKTVTHQMETVFDNGEFTFGSEMVDDELMYTYYRRDGDGFYDIVKKIYIHADLTTIHRCDSSLETPYIDVHIVTDKDRNPNWFPSSENRWNQKYDIYIPKIK